MFTDPVEIKGMFYLKDGPHLKFKNLQLSIPPDNYFNSLVGILQSGL